MTVAAAAAVDSAASWISSIECNDRSGETDTHARAVESIPQPGRAAVPCGRGPPNDHQTFQRRH